MLKMFKTNGKSASIHPLAFGIAAGIVWGAKVLVGTWIAMSCGQASGCVADAVASCPYYTMTFPGSLIGFAWGFVRGFISFTILAWIYNKLVK